MRGWSTNPCCSPSGHFSITKISHLAPLVTTGLSKLPSVTISARHSFTQVHWSEQCFGPFSNHNHMIHYLLTMPCHLICHLCYTLSYTHCSIRNNIGAIVESVIVPFWSNPWSYSGVPGAFSTRCATKGGERSISCSICCWVSGPGCQLPGLAILVEISMPNRHQVFSQLWATMPLLYVGKSPFVRTTRWDQPSFCWSSWLWS